MKNTLILLVLIGALFNMARIQKGESTSLTDGPTEIIAARKPASSEQPIRPQHLPSKNKNTQKNYYNPEYDSSHVAEEEQQYEVTTEQDVQNEYEAQADYQENITVAGQEDPNFNPEPSYDYDRNVAQENVSPEYFSENGAGGNLEYQQPAYEAPISGE